MKTSGRSALQALLACAMALLAQPSVFGVGGESVKPRPPAPPGVPAPPSPEAPIPPRPPKGLHHLSGGTKRYYLAPDETHKGDLYFMSESVQIAGTQEGDLSVFAREIEIPGTVTGDINAWVQTADLSGKMGDAVRVFCQDLTVSGRIDGDLIAVCASVVIAPDAHITGDVNAKAAAIEVRGTVDGDVVATGGQVVFSGKAGGDAALKADVVEIDPGARIDGDLTYTSREPIEVESGKVVHGSVSYSPEKSKPAVSRGGCMKWFFLMATALLSGLGILAIFRQSAAGVVATVRGDGLKSAGIGFITAIVIPVAAVISCILIITIPAALLVLLIYGLLVYLSQVPVAVLLGELVLKRLGRDAPSPFVSAAIGVPILYLVFAIPFLGKIAIFATVFTGFGAIVITMWAIRQARRGGPAGMGQPMASAATT